MSYRPVPKAVGYICASGGLALLAVNAFVCFDPWLENALQHVGHVSLTEEVAASFTVFIWTGGGLFAFAALADSVNLKQAWSRLTTASTIGWFTAFLGTEFTTVPRDLHGDPVIGLLIFAWSIAGAICLLQEIPFPLGDALSLRERFTRRLHNAIHLRAGRI